MIHIVDFFTHTFGAGGSIIVAVIFFALAILGVIIAMRGRGAIDRIVGICSWATGTLSGAMLGLLCFNSLILMIILAAVGGVLLLYTVKNAKGIGYFIGIASLGWFLAFVITSEMNITDARFTENTLLFIDLVIGLGLGLLAALRSKYLVSVITAASGGVITAISTLAMIGYYFADTRTWVVSAAVALAGFAVQIHTYDLKSEGKNKKRR